MLHGQLRNEVSKPSISLSRVQAICRANPVGAVVDNKVRAKVWATLLLEGQAIPPLPPLLTNNKLEGEDARVIDADTKRTRGYLPIFQETTTQDLIRKLLTTYCLANGVKYKQGMHELLAAFVALSPDPPAAPLPAEMIYVMFSSFLTRYLSPFFRDDGTRVLQEGFALFQILLAYHDPLLAEHLDQNDFPPALYLTPMLVTLFAHNLEMYLVHRLWDTYISLGDPTLVFYLALGLLRVKRPLLLAAGGGGERGRCAELPEMISQVRIRAAEDIAELVPLALEACKRTPFSFVRDLRRTTLATGTGERGEPGEGVIHQEEEGQRGGGGGEDKKEKDEEEEGEAWHLRPDCHCVEISSAEIIRTLTQQEEQAREEQRAHQGQYWLFTNSSTVSPDASPARRGNSLPPSSPLSSPHFKSSSTSPTSSPTHHPQPPQNKPSPPPLPLVILDVRSHEEYGHSGGGRLKHSLRLPPEAAMNPPALQSWLESHELWPGRQQLCVIGSKIRRRKRRMGGGGGGGGGMYFVPSIDEQDAVWRRLLLREGEEEEEEEEEDSDVDEEENRRGGVSGKRPVNHDTGDAAVRGLRALGYPYVGKMKGGFSNLVDYLVLVRGGATLTPSTAARSTTAWVEHHDAMAWEKWRRRQWQASRLPPLLYTTTGLQRPLVAPSGPHDEDARYWPSGTEGMPLPRHRMKADELLALAEAQEVAERYGHVHAVRGIQETTLAQKLLVKFGLGMVEEEEEEEEEVDDGSGEDEGFDMEEGQKKGMLLSLSRLGSRSSSNVGAGGGGEGGGKGGGEVLEKAVHLLDKADSWMSKVVLRSGIGGSGSHHPGSGGNV